MKEYPMAVEDPRNAYSEEDRDSLHAQTIWTRYASIMLGVWLITIPLTFTLHSHVMFWNDIVSGLLLIIFGVYSVCPRCYWAPWAICLVGIWLQLAPLIFWAPDSLSYLNDTVTGALAISFSILIPGVAGETLRQGIEIPVGWSYNPSSWLQRLPIIVLGCVGWFVARYMAAYQLGYRDSVWDPIFGDGTLKVITSNVSRSFPVSDAGLGAVAYTLEALMGCKGSSRRWCTMPWIVVLFGILVIPLGFTSIILIMLQPIVVGYWCSWCLLTAACMLIMIALTIDEVAAVLQYMAQIRRKGMPFWGTFWKGGTIPGDAIPADLRELEGPFSKMFFEMVKGVTVPWNLLLSALIGAWLMFSQSLIQVVGSAADSNHILGALIVTISIIVMAEVIRRWRFLNVLFGAWMIGSPWLLSGFSEKGKWMNVALGIILILLSIRKGKIRESYGSAGINTASTG
jgi:Vitamin K epoxide reductase family/SPW repeat